MCTHTPARSHLKCLANHLSFWLVLSNASAHMHQVTTWHCRMFVWVSYDSKSAWFPTVWHTARSKHKRTTCMKTREKSPFITKSAVANFKWKSQAQPFRTIQIICTPLTLDKYGLQRKVYTFQKCFELHSYATHSPWLLLANMLGQYTILHCIALHWFVCLLQSRNHNFCRFPLFTGPSMLFMVEEHFKTPSI